MSRTHKRASPAIQALARAGYASRGVLYLLIALFAFLAALGAGEDAQGSEGALERTLLAPFGVLLVAAIALGLIGYSVWRFCQAVFDVDDHGTDLRGLTVRGALLVSSITHLLLAGAAGLSVVRLIGVQQAGGTSGGGGQADWTRWLMAQPFGRWLVVIVGLAMIGAGIAHFLKGHREGFEKYFEWTREQRRWLSPICVFGLYARSVTLVIIGGFFLYAAWRYDPSQAGGIEMALDWLGSQAFGAWLLAAMAVGLGAFGVYSLTESFVRRVGSPAA